MMNSNRHPDRIECYEFLRNYNTPPHVVEHCKGVAAVAYVIGKALNDSDSDLFKLDLDLILSAGLLHDMARVEPDHGGVCADFLEPLGLKQEAEIIRVHMKYDGFTDMESLNETDIVCLADRIVLENRYAGIDTRMEYIIAKAERNGHPEWRNVILRKKEETKVFIKLIEDKIGMSLDDLIEGIDYECPEK